ncbi:MAG: type I DNA topoisomerase [Pirellulaceae bacterium]|jgi:DNA topoisomerase-1|nr:type I DNA topoisomerase [Pirellulaceae bacterium]MDP7017669.1 type I DNA topoisomerase [Pirellulaceae bacterium]
MAKTDKKSLVIVESPAKAKTIQRFLGPGYEVEASIGHIRDLPEGKKEVPEQFKKEEWAYLGVNVEDDFSPIYVVPSEKKSQVSKLRKLLKDSKDLLLATDEDREGEAISWHLFEVLAPKVPVKRLVFHEITKEAIDNSLANAREIDEGLVKAQETRRILDRLYGYDISQLLWKKIGKDSSAGRVQSVALRMIVERERERRRFVTANYWDLTAKFATEEKKEFTAELVSVDGKRVPSRGDFDAETGKPNKDGLLILDEAAAKELAARLETAEFRIASLEDKPFSDPPPTPFTTSTLQQQANIKLGYTARRTMDIAQSLYVNSYITYMRTDSTNLANEAVEAARHLVKSEYGDEYVPSTPRRYDTKVKNAQEAHEAIRPASDKFVLPEALKGDLSNEQFRLFELIWKRTIASQMENSRGRHIAITIEGAGAVFRVSGKVIEFPGFLRAYVEGSDDPDAKLSNKETLLPPVQKDESVDCTDLAGNSHTTKPPARYTEASLTKNLEKKGIGRPSTFATIIDTILAERRKYAFKKGNALVPTWKAFAVCRLMEEHFPWLVDYEFTAEMEEYLDSISRGEAEHIEYLRSFYFGDSHPGLKKQVELKLGEIDARELNQFEIGRPSEGEFTAPVVVRVGRWGPFIEQGDKEADPDHYRSAQIPADLAPDELKLDIALELLLKSQTGDEPIGTCPETGKPVFAKTGRFGDYVQLGATDDDEKPKNASLLAGMELGDVTVEMALKLLSLPRTVGEHPESKEPIVAANGRYGPYIKCESETRSLPAELSPLEVNLTQALELLAQPKRRGRAAPKEPIKVFEASPVTGEPIKLLDGRYGPYVADGQTNASLPRDADPAELTMEQAVTLLAERAAKGPSKKKKKKAAKKKATKKKATKKKTAKKKKAAKKKS